MNPFSIRVYEIVGSGLCVASEDGQKVFDQIAAILRQEKPVEISFMNVDHLTSAFLNASIGQLYGIFSEEKIREYLSVSDLSQEDLALLKRVVDTAKAYFQNPERMKRIVRDVLGDEDE